MAVISFGIRRFLQLGISLFLILASLGLQSCDHSNTAMTIAGHKFPGYEFIFLARDEGWLSPQLVKLQETKSASESLEALATGAVDGAMLTLDETLSARNQGIPLTIVLILDRSVGADGLLATPAINQLNQLKGKRIGVENTAVGRLVLKFALQQAGLELTDINPVHLTVNQHVEACNMGVVDAIVTYEPYLSAIANQGWHNLIDSRELDLIFDVLAIRTDKLPMKGLAINHLIEKHFIATQGWRNTSIDTIYRLSKGLGVASTEIPMLYRGLDLPDLDYNRHMLASNNPYLLGVANRVSTFLDYPNALIGAERNLFTTDFLPNDLP